MKTSEKIDSATNRDIKAMHEGFIRTQNTCPLCNSTLEIKAISYLENYTLREEATCPKCKVLARIKDHKMH